MKKHRSAMSISVQTADPDDLAAGRVFELSEEELQKVSAGADPVPTEQISFNYTDIEWTYNTTTDTSFKSR